MTGDNFHTLLNKWRSGQMTLEEAREFAAAVNTGKYDRQLEDIMEVDADTERFQLKAVQDIQQKDWQWLEEKIKYTVKPVHRVHLLRTAWFRVAVAVLIILTGWAVYNRFFGASETSGKMAATSPSQPDILPGGNRAVLTLVDGSRIILDSAATGQLAQQTGATIRKSANGEIIYAFDQSTASAAVAYNTMNTPRGGQYQLVLPDGSKVWLNAESSITFPTVFESQKREVSITGEVYFEVKTNAAKPFIVHTPGKDITVLGTSFNVNAYPDEPSMKTSLAEGMIKVGDIVIKPGQAVEKDKIVNTDISQDLSWKNGIISLENKTVEEVMRELLRWYNITVVYDNGPIHERLSGAMYRDIPLTEALNGLEGVAAKFRIEGRTVHVAPLK